MIPVVVGAVIVALILAAVLAWVSWESREAQRRAIRMRDEWERFVAGQRDEE